MLKRRHEYKIVCPHCEKSAGGANYVSKEKETRVNCIFCQKVFMLKCGGTSIMGNYYLTGPIPLPEVLKITEYN